MNYLILVRHGESRWNLSNKFTGWVDVPLSEEGVNEAVQCASRLENLEIDVAFTSHLSRAQQTLSLILSQQYFTGYFVHDEDKGSINKYMPKEIEKEDIPIYSSRKLNERYYGDLQGMNKKMAKKIFGEEEVFKWRRGFDGRPPGGESLKDTYDRAVPYFKETIMDHLDKNRNVIVSAHGNSLRVIVKYIEGISDEDIPNLDLPTGESIIYKYEKEKLIKISKEHTFGRPLEWGNNL